MFQQCLYNIAGVGQLVYGDECAGLVLRSSLRTAISPDLFI